MNKTVVRLWETETKSELAIKFSKLPPEKKPEKSDFVWVPKSIIEHITRMPAGQAGWKECGVTLPDWFVTKAKL